MQNCIGFQYFYQKNTAPPTHICHTAIVLDYGVVSVNKKRAVVNGAITRGLSIEYIPAPRSVIISAKLCRWYDGSCMHW